MFSQPLVLTSNRSKVNVSYNADLVIDDYGMSVEQLIQTDKGMKLFESDPKKVKLTRRTIDSQLVSEDITNEMKYANHKNNYGQYIRIKSHYKFDENNSNTPSARKPSYSTDPKQAPTRSEQSKKQSNVDENENKVLNENNEIILKGFQNAGIISAGKLCYVNAPMQCLFQIPGFIKLFKSLENFANNDVLILELNDLCKTYFESDNAVNLEEFVQVVLSQVKQGKVQHQGVNQKGDSSEFLENLINGLIGGKSNRVTEKFSGFFTSVINLTYECGLNKNCNSLTKQFEQNTITIQNVDTTHYYDYFRTGMFHIKGTNQICSKCNNTMDCLTMDYIKLPEILNIHLEQKKNKNQRYPIQMKLNGNQNQFSYRLCGIVDYRPKEKHFVAYVKIQDGTWRECDDFIINPYEIKIYNNNGDSCISSNDFESPYILFYNQE